MGVVEFEASGRCRRMENISTTDVFLFELPLNLGENRRTNAPPQEVALESSDTTASIESRCLRESGEARTAGGKGRGVDL
jgi:hypothetical protein